MLKGLVTVLLVLIAVSLIILCAPIALIVTAIIERKNKLGIRDWVNSAILVLWSILYLVTNGGIRFFGYLRRAVHRAIRLMGIGSIILVAMVGCTKTVEKTTRVETTKLDSTYLENTYKSLSKSIDSLSFKVLSTQREVREAMSSATNKTVIERDTAGRVVKEVYETTNIVRDLHSLESTRLQDIVNLMTKSNDETLKSLEVLKNKVTSLESSTKVKTGSSKVLVIVMVIAIVAVGLIIIVARLR